MKILIISLLSTFLVTSTWQTDIKTAEQIAQTENKFIVLNFSGSDWCGPCIRMHKEIFNSDVFTKFAADNLVLVNADFPRSKKNQLSAEQQKKNDQMAETYNRNGVFPLTFLLTSDGKVVKQWEGYPNESADDFTNEVKAAMNANK